MGSRACVRAVIPRTRGRVINQAVRRFGRLVRCPDCWPRFPAMLRDFVVTPLGARALHRCASDGCSRRSQAALERLGREPGEMRRYNREWTARATGRPGSPVRVKTHRDRHRVWHGHARYASERGGRTHRAGFNGVQPVGPAAPLGYGWIMCGRARLSSDVSEIKLVFSIPPHRPSPNFPPSWNVAPTDSLPVAGYDSKAGDRSLDMLRWGLVPFWAKISTSVSPTSTPRPRGSRTGRPFAKLSGAAAALCRSTISTNGQRQE
jgi:hypothetical protein